MYFIIETEEQLQKLKIEDTCFIQIISSNDKYHPVLTRASLLYYRNSSKGYIICIKHSEGFSLNIQYVNEFLNKHSKVYLLDYKYHSYFLNLSNYVDVNFTQLDKDNYIKDLSCDTKLQFDFYKNYDLLETINEIIPITKHYERCECLYNKIKDYIDLEIDIDYQKNLITAYKLVEQSGIGIDYEKFKKTYDIQNDKFFIKNNVLYGNYNLYNLTGRPTNAFNGFNLLAIKKEKEFRSCFVPTKDYFVEFDFDAYHLRLIAKLINYKFPNPKESIHIYLAKQYFLTDNITEDQYKESKSISFKQLYGGLESKYKNIDFFKYLHHFIEEKWLIYKKNGAVVLPTGRILRSNKGMNKLKLFNYFIQNMETKENVYKINKIHDIIKQKNYSSKLVLITYDSFLLDYCISDGKSLLLDIKNILQGEGDDFILVKHKYGKDYFLKD